MINHYFALCLALPQLMGALAEQISKDLQKLITAWEVFSVALRDEALDFIRRITTFSIFERILILLLLLDF